MNFIYIIKTIKDMEIWKEIENGNQVSNYGRVKNDKGFCKIYRTAKDIMIVKIGDKSHQLNKIVAKYFVENPNNENYVYHIDGDKTNCEADNLKWVSYKEGFKLRNKDFDKKPKSIIVFKDNMLVGKFYSIREASQKLNLAQPNITAQLKGRVKTVKGYTFERI